MKYRLLMLMVVIFLCGCAKREYSGEMDVISNQLVTSSNGVMEVLIVIANQADIDDYEKCAKEIISHCLNNDFKSIRFSYDISGYPNVVKATVYLTEEDMEKENVLFKMTYEPSLPECNIKDNSEQYTLKIERFDE